MFHDPQRTLLVSLAVAVILVYGFVLGYLFLRQSAFIYFPNTAVVSPARAGLPQATVIAVSTSDGERLVAWHVPAEEGWPLFLYFHGNSGHLAGLAERFAALTARGAGLLAIDYRGYGGSSGTPSEKGLLLDGEAAYAETLARGYPPERIVLVGESLGTGVAVALAVRERVAGVVLEAAYSSVVALAASIYWMFPIRLLMKDTFRSDRRVARIAAPLLFLHGTADAVIPIRHGERLFALAPEPKTFLTVAGGTHQVLARPEILAYVLAWADGVCGGPRTEAQRKNDDPPVPRRDSPSRAT